MIPYTVIAGYSTRHKRNVIEHILWRAPLLSPVIADLIRNPFDDATRHLIINKIENHHIGQRPNGP